MADTKITALTALTAADPANDVIPIVDVSDTSMAASGTTKKISVNNILGASGTATLASATITGDLTVRTNKLVVTSTGAGFGTATPGTSLEVWKDLIRVNSDVASGVYGTQFWRSGVERGRYGFDFSASLLELQADGDIRFLTGGENERLRIDSSGNVGIGVTPNTWSAGYKFLMLPNGGSLFNDTSNGIYLGANYYALAGSKKIASGYALNYLLDATAGAYKWFTSTAGAGTAGDAVSLTQAMTLDATGNFHVGTTAYVNVATNVINSLSGYNLVPNNTGNAGNRNWQLAANGSTAGNLDFTVSSANNTYPNSAYRMQLTSAGALNNTTGTYGTISDLRLKENISDARNYLADLLKLRVVKYSLKEESSAVATKLGFIAQEVEQVFPNLVDQSDKEYEGAEGIRSVKTSILIPMLLKAIQELTARVQTLEAR
jgi:hypothetical protein